MSSYHAVALCVANTCNDEAREIIAVIEESVRLEDIAKFVLTAHGKKMDRTSSKTRDLRFLGGNRSLQQAARNQSTLVALPGGVKLPGMSNIPCFGWKVGGGKKKKRGNCCTMVCGAIVLLIIASSIM